MGKQGLPKFGEPVSRRVMFDKFAVDALLERGEPPLHRRLADAEGFRRRQRAAFARDRKKISQIIPVKHDVQHLCRTAEQSCGCSALRPSVTDRAWLSIAGQPMSQGE